MLWQSPGREPYHKTHARYFCTCVEKKAHTSKRVSIIACNNVISKAKLCDARKGNNIKQSGFISKVFYSALLFATDMRESHL